MNHKINYTILNIYTGIVAMQRRRRSLTRSNSHTSNQVHNTRVHMRQYCHGGRKTQTLYFDNASSVLLNLTQTLYNYIPEIKMLALSSLVSYNIQSEVGYSICKSSLVNPNIINAWLKKNSRPSLPARFTAEQARNAISSSLWGDRASDDYIIS